MTRPHSASSVSSPAVPDGVPVRDVVDRCEPLQLLRQRLLRSQQYLEAIRPVLPAELRPLAAAGPLDEAGWTLLAAHTAAAAKLRQLRPHLEAALRERGWQVSVVRVRIQPGNR